MPTVLKSGSLNLLEISEPVQNCNGIAVHLPLPLTLHLVGYILEYQYTYLIILSRSILVIIKNVPDKVVKKMITHIKY